MAGPYPNPIFETVSLVGAETSQSSSDPLMVTAGTGGQIIGGTIANGGSGYVTGDLVSPQGGLNQGNALFVVTASGGVITGLGPAANVTTGVPYYGGWYSTFPAVLASLGTWSGVGTGATANLTFGPIGIQSNHGINVTGDPYGGGAHVRVDANGFGVVDIGSHDQQAITATIGFVNFHGRDSANAITGYASIAGQIFANTSGSATGKLTLYARGTTVGTPIQQELQVGRGTIFGCPTDALNFPNDANHDGLGYGTGLFYGAIYTGVSIAGGAIQLSDTSGNLYSQSAKNIKGATYTIGESHLPFILVSSGSMGNNGALTGITALRKTYVNAYVYMPAGAIASGSLAGWYYAVFSSSSAATLYNNVYTSGTPTIPGSPTAFATTGPGAYTQTTASFITAYSVQIPGGTLGITSGVRVAVLGSNNNSAGQKNLKCAYAGYTFSNIAVTTTLSIFGQPSFWNAGVTNIQIGPPGGSLPVTSGTALSDGAIDSTANQNLTVQLELATATDYIVLEIAHAEVVQGI